MERANGSRNRTPMSDGISIRNIMSFLLTLLGLLGEMAMAMHEIQRHCKEKEAEYLMIKKALSNLVAGCGMHKRKHTEAEVEHECIRRPCGHGFKC